MPLPFILAAAAAAAVGYGAKKGYDGYQDKSEADDIIDSAKRKYNHAESDMKKSESATETSLTKLGSLQLKIGSDFSEFRKIADDLLKQLSEKSHKDLTVNIPKHKLDQIKHVEFSSVDFLAKTAGAAAGGAAAAYAVYGGVMALGAASTGTSIAALSGAAAYNATMAAIGGGALSAGGFGMAGGAAVLGGVVAAPIAAIAGWAYASYGEEALKKAREIRNEVNEAVNKMEVVQIHLAKTKEYANKIHDGTDRIYSVFKNYFNDLKAIDAFIRNNGDLASVKEAVVNIIENGYKVAAILTDIITTPLFKVKKDKNGNPALNKDNVIEMETDSDGMKIINGEAIDGTLVASTYQIKQYQ